MKGIELSGEGWKKRLNLIRIGENCGRRRRNDFVCYMREGWKKRLNLIRIGENCGRRRRNDFVCYMREGKMEDGGKIVE